MVSQFTAAGNFVQEELVVQEQLVRLPESNAGHLWDGQRARVDGVR